ncbi:MAG: cytochrome c peroxidase [Chitinophagaceae bacterium]
MSLNTFPLAKSYRKATAVVAIFVIIICIAHFKPPPLSINEKVDKYFEQQLGYVTITIKNLRLSCQKKAPVKILRQQFFSSRLAYKKLAVLSEYFNVYETKFINGPAVPRVEEDNPDHIIPSQGYQAIEQLLYSPWNASSYKEIEILTAGIQEMMTRLKNEPDRMFKFRDELLFDALKSTVTRLVTLGITGFDSPVSSNSLQEAKATLKGMQAVLKFYKEELDKRDGNIYNELNGTIIGAINYLSAHNDFNQFDRLAFIVKYANAIAAKIKKAGNALGIANSNGLAPVSRDVNTIFEKDAFDIRFFTPDKEYLATAERIELGKQLFYDPILSSTKNRSCASCHKPELAFTDGLKTALSVDNKKYLIRNTPTLLNSVFQTRQFWDSREDILENQLNNVVHNAEEMSGSLPQSANDLKNDPHYNALFKKAYEGETEPISAFNIANAISSYVRSLQSLNSRFDQYIRGDQKQLSANEKNGFNLFTGKAKCGTCHFVPLFNGLVPPEFSETESEVLGVPQTKEKIKATIDPDSGKYNFTKSIIHRYAFKIPTVRNIELTAPYMHNGVFSTLDEVMEFYNNGGGKGLKIAPENQTLPFDKLNLSKKEIADIISFMKSLTDTSYLKTVKYK